MTEFALYVPAPESDLNRKIDPGSAIVGTPAEKWIATELGGGVVEKLMIDFEGNRYGASNIVTLADRARWAAGRHQEHYPTIARMAVDASQLVRAGTFHSDAGRIQISNAQEFVALMRWLDIESSDQLADELRTTDRMEAR